MRKLLIILAVLLPTCLFAQDRIILKQGSVLEAKVVEIGDGVVKYKRFSNPGGPTYSISKKDVEAIWYENGEEEQMGNTNSPSDVSYVSEETMTLRAGTDIPIRISHSVKAADVMVGQTVDFKVSRDIIVNGVTLIPYGTAVKGTVYEAKKSSWWGTKGRLGIRIENINLQGGGLVPLNNGNVYVVGTNRTALSVLLFLFVTIPACAICGSKAQVPEGYEIMASVAAPVMFKEENGVISVVGQQTLPKVESRSSDENTMSLPRRATIIRTNSTVIDAIVYSTDGEVIKYKKRRYPNGEMYEIPKSIVRNVKY